MSKREDLHTILVLGSGPITIGQAAEFDYSGTQAVKVLRQKGYRIVLVNSNPATVMTDPELADATYIEPLTVEAVEQIILKEKPDAILPTVGGQTGLNLALALSEAGILEKNNVELIGADLDAIRKAEDRFIFRKAMLEAKIPVPIGGPAYSLADAEKLVRESGFPVLIRASFALGGSGAAWVYSPEELPAAIENAILESPIKQAWVEQSVLGWKEFELEVMRDKADNFVVVCSIENLDPIGIHTGDSITVAPSQTLTDREYQVMRNLAAQVMTVVGVETGGSNVQFAINPKTGEILVIEMNPRVSRSSALASKATGFPIAKIAALLAVGYTLDEITNDITGQTKAAFEPSLDYVVVKIPRWSFEKFPGVDSRLGPQMKSVGEVMALGRTFPEALQKAVQSLEIGVDALDGSGPTKQLVSEKFLDLKENQKDEWLSNLKTPNANRLFYVYSAIRDGMDLNIIAGMTGYDYWFLAEMQEIADFENQLIQSSTALSEISKESLLQAKRLGFSDTFLARVFSKKGNKLDGMDVRLQRKKLGVLPTFQQVDTCAAEFEARTPYLYSAYEFASEAEPTDRKKILILGGGPNRIGQGIEFDYCCCQAAFELAKQGFEIIMLNCNPETVSTDYDTSDRLYFEPMTLEHVLNVVERESPQGVILQLGGQTPLNLAEDLTRYNIPVLGTDPASIDLTEDREKFSALLKELDIPHPEYGIAHSLEEAAEVVKKIGYPVLVRPSFVLGGRAMAIVENESQLAGFVNMALEVNPGKPLLIDRFMENAFEIDVDALGDGEQVFIGAIMQHIEEAGVHSGDSACVLPPFKVSAYHLHIIREYTQRLGLALNVKGLINIQYAIKDDIVYVLEVNPRASRTVPFASKATGQALARIAARIMAGDTLKDLNIFDEINVNGFFVKEAVLPFKKLSGTNPILGPEMRSTGEVMGHASHFGHAFAKAEIAAGTDLPLEGTVLFSVNDFDKGSGLLIARDLHRMGFKLMATPGTAEYFRKAGLPVRPVNKISLGPSNVIDIILDGKVDMIVNTPLGLSTHSDGASIRSVATLKNIPLLTTLSAALAAVTAIRALKAKELQYLSLQEHYASSLSERPTSQIK